MLHFSHTSHSIFRFHYVIDDYTISVSMLNAKRTKYNRKCHFGTRAQIHFAICLRYCALNIFIIADENMAKFTSVNGLCVERILYSSNDHTGNKQASIIPF